VVEGFLGGLHQSPYKGFSVEFADHREYVAGDDVRHIDWRLHAKTDRYFIKQYEVETNLRTYLLLDCSGSMAYPEQDAPDRMNKWTYAATLAASLAYLLVGQQDGAGLILFDNRVREQLPVRSNRQHLRTLVSAIEATTPVDATDMGVLFDTLADRIARRSMVVIISDLLTDVDRVLAGLQRLRYDRHEVLLLHVLDHDELEFPFSDRTLFEGIEQADLEVLTDPQSLRQAYLDRVQDFLGRLRGMCLNLKVDYALVSTADPIDAALVRFLSTRMHRNRARA